MGDRYGSKFKNLFYIGFRAFERATGGVAGGDVRPASSATSSATTISGYTTINEPGSYTLTQDIINTDNTTCIHINTSDVVFDGPTHHPRLRGEGRQAPWR